MKQTVEKWISNETLSKSQVFYFLNSLLEIPLNHGQNSWQTDFSYHAETSLAYLIKEIE